MITNFRALCAELLLFGEQAISEREGLWPRSDHNKYDLLLRARAALAVPEPDELTDEEIEAWANASDDVPKEFLDPDSGRWERCLSTEEFCTIVRAVLDHFGDEA